MTRRSSPPATLPPGERDRLVGWMPAVIRWDGLTAEERAFCISIAGRERRSPGFAPSEKQARWMGDLVARFQAATMGAGT